MTPQEDPAAHVGDEEFTAHLLRTDRTSRQIRDALARTQSAMAKAGWDGLFARPQLFQLYTDPQTGGSRVEPSVLTETLHMLAEHNPHVGIGECMVRLAEVMEMGRSLSDAGVVQDFAPGYFEQWAATSVGYGIATEVFMATYREDENGEQDPTPPSEREDRTEARLVVFSARDGVIWVASRERRPRARVSIRAVKPDSSESGIVGALTHGLVRMTAVCRSNPIPVPPRAFRKAGR